MFCLVEKKGKWWQSMCLLGCDVRGGCGDWIWRRVGSDLAWHPVRPLSSSFQPSADGKWTPMKTLDSSASLKVESSTRKNCDIHRFRYTPNIPTTWHLCRCSKSDRLPLRRTPDTGHPLATNLFWPIVSEVNAASTWKQVKLQSKRITFPVEIDHFRTPSWLWINQLRALLLEYSTDWTLLALWREPVILFPQRFRGEHCHLPSKSKWSVKLVKGEKFVAATTVDKQVRSRGWAFDADCHGKQARLKISRCFNRPL